MAGRGGNARRGAAQCSRAVRTPPPTARRRSAVDKSSSAAATWAVSIGVMSGTSWLCGQDPRPESGCHRRRILRHEAGDVGHWTDCGAGVVSHGRYPLSRPGGGVLRPNKSERCEEMPSTLVARRPREGRHEPMTSRQTTVARWARGVNRVTSPARRDQRRPPRPRPHARHGSQRIGLECP